MVAFEAASSISRIEAFHYRSLRQVSLRLRPFQALLGPNGSGKSTLIDALAFLCDVQRVSVEGAVYGDDRQDVPMRARNPCHLTWMHDGGRFELALEASIPAELREEVDGRNRNTCRYAIAIDTSGPPRLVAETLSVGDRPSEGADAVATLPSLAGQDRRVPKPEPAGWVRLLLDGEDQLSNWKSQIGSSGPPKSIVHWSGDGKRTSLPYYGPDSGYKLLAWFRELIAPPQRICLSGEALRRPNPLRAVDSLGSDGGNFANFLHGFRRQEPKRYRLWVRHVREALPDISDVRTRERPEDYHRYVVVQFVDGLEAPSWLVSEGTLRLLALTSLAYAPSRPGLCAIEEPENGIHPRALETVVQSLSSAYDRQVLLATHSPLIARLVAPDDILCFQCSPEEGTAVVAGHEHPRLKSWQGTTDLGTLLASGVL